MILRRNLTTTTSDPAQLRTAINSLRYALKHPLTTHDDVGAFDVSRVVSLIHFRRNTTVCVCGTILSACLSFCLSVWWHIYAILSTILEYCINLSQTVVLCMPCCELSQNKKGRVTRSTVLTKTRQMPKIPYVPLKERKKTIPVASSVESPSDKFLSGIQGKGGRRGRSTLGSAGDLMRCDVMLLSCNIFFMLW